MGYFNSNKKLLFILNLLVYGFIFIFCVYTQCINITMPTLFSSSYHVTVQYMKHENNNITNTRQWKELHRSDVYKEQTIQICKHQNWKDILSPCKSNLNWTHRSKRHNFEETSSLLSAIELHIRPVSYPSVITIRTKNQKGFVKTIGGDFWDVKIRGRLETMLNIQMHDNENGSYTGYFLLTESGNYNVTCILESTLCNGLRDPPEDWFIKGRQSIILEL